LYIARRDAGELIVKILDLGIAKVKLAPVFEREAFPLSAISLTENRL
jgi:hypothetical protein